MSRSAARTQSGVATVEQTRDAFQSIGQAVVDITDRIGTISRATGEIASVAEESSAAAEEVSASTEQTAATAHELASAAEGLNETRPSSAGSSASSHCRGADLHGWLPENSTHGVGGRLLTPTTPEPGSHATMHLLNRLSIRAKLYAGFGVVVALLVAATATAFWGFSQLGERREYGGQRGDSEGKERRAHAGRDRRLPTIREWNQNRT